jgi:magnesium chelatase family protein
LDELPEFGREVLEVLRQPLEDGQVTISRAVMSLTYPSRFMLVAAMNPCPCGYLGDTAKSCICTPLQVQKYRARISGPLLDRIDLHIQVPRLRQEEMGLIQSGEPSSQIRSRVLAARKLQARRFEGRSVSCNAAMGSKELKDFCAVDEDTRELLFKAITQFGLSARAYSRTLKLARTIADLAGEEDILRPHVAEAVQYRVLDRTAW